MKKGFSVSLALMLCAVLSLGALAEQDFLGTWEDKVFTSEVAGLTVTLPAGWWTIEGDSLDSMKATATKGDDRLLLGMMAMKGADAIITTVTVLDEGESAEDFVADFVDGNITEGIKGAKIQEITIGENVWTAATIERKGATAGMYFLYRETEIGVVIVKYATVLDAMPVDDFLDMFS